MGACRSVFQFHASAFAMCPFSYSVMSSSTSMTRTDGASRCWASHSVPTSASGFAYSAMWPSFPGESDFGGGNPPAAPTGWQVRRSTADGPSGRSEVPEGRLGLLGHHLGGPGRTEHHLALDVLDPGEAREQLVHLGFDHGPDRAAHRREGVRDVNPPLIRVDVDLVHQAQIHDVDPELGVVDVLEGLEDLVLRRDLAVRRGRTGRPRVDPLVSDFLRLSAHLGLLASYRTQAPGHGRSRRGTREGEERVHGDRKSTRLNSSHVKRSRMP